MFSWIFIMALSCIELNPKVWMQGIKRGRIFFMVQVGRYVVGLILSFVIIYFLLIDISITGLMNTFGFIVAINLMISGLFHPAHRVDDKEKQLKSKRKAKRVPLQSGIGFLFFIVLLFLNFVYPFTVTQDLAEMGEIETSTDQIESVTEEAVRSVPYTYARYKSEIAFGNIDNYSFYEMGETSIQKIDEELFWVSPIEYASIWRWWRADSAPGYIMVSAEDPNAEAELVDNYEMEYVPSAFLNENLERHVRKKYEDIILMGVSFEPDDDGKPYYAYSYAYYDHYRTGPDADGVILIDARTGDMEKYKLGEQPEFVDNAIDYKLALDYASWFGTYSNGLLNSIFAKEGVHEPTSEEEMIGVLGPDNDMYWMVDHMRPNQDSNTMVGFTMVNAQTGEATYYTGSSGLLNAGGAREVVDKSFQREQWSGTQPVLYSVYDSYTWVVPVVDQNGLMREIAMVHADTGTIAHGSTREEAFSSYRQTLASDLDTDDYTPTDILEEETVEGTVYRVSDVNDQVIQVLITGESRVLEFDVTSIADVVFLREGDEIEAQVVDTEENVLNVVDYTNVTIEEEFGGVEEFDIEEETGTNSEAEPNEPAENEGE
ncbi:hypothetical protein D7Z54_18445 [Salibacterium salarium]|uniref:Uncharacterized protein n=1 Tax=Salibacterium salarium TaxID=284579 RepID=A0A3R9PJ92_9BACI|nr:hypothetical protein [Salibacterium salarium]RSL31959.1 hypothetical protein D7Z54_18445 [Salibacterium salarium]